MDCFPLFDDINTGPDFSKASRAEFLFAEIPASDIFFIVVVLL
jgi:hypothetical protein